MATSEPRDHVDEILAQWGRERPDLDVSGMAITGRLSRLDHELRRRIDTVFAAHDLQSWEFDVLATLLRNGAPHELTPGELLDSMMITSGAMTNRLQRLEDRGLIRRTKSAADGRKVVVSLTAGGRRVVDAALVDHTANQRAIVGGLTSRQQAQLVTLLRALGSTLDALAEDDPVE